MMAKEYKNRGGDYNTPKSDKDESQKHLEKWGEEEWQTKEGSAHAKKSDGSRKRYLPKKAWEEMSEGEKEETDKKKQEEGKDGKQFVGNTGRAKRARKNANEKEDEEYAVRQNGEADKEEKQEQDEKPQRVANTGQKRGTSKKQSTDHEKKKASDDKPDKTASQSNKRGRPQKNDQPEEEADDDDDESEQEQQPPPAKKTQQKKGKSTAKEDSGKTIGSRKDKATPPAKQASLDRLPKKGTQAYWKAMPGWVDGKVVEVLKKGKSVDG